LLLPSQQAQRLWPLALLLGISLYSLFFWLIDPALSPIPADYKQVEKTIRSEFKDGDAIATRPWWAARAREYVGDLSFVQVRDLAAEDLSLYSRLWVISLPGHHNDLSGPFLDETYQLEKEQQHGSLVLKSYRLPDRAEVLYDFRKELKSAQVLMRSKNSAKQCARWIDNRWVCSRHDWNYVGRMIVELGDDPREVIWAHPADDPIEIIYRQVPGGKTLLVHTGFTPPAARTPDGADVTLQVLLNGREIGKIVQQNQSGYFARRFDLSSYGPGPHEVTFVVKAKNGGMRHFCFDGQVRG